MNHRQTHNLIQSSPEWHAFRSNHYGSSELSAAMGESKYTSRNDLLQEKATGISKEVDAHTQALFDKGHAAEESARSIAERIIGEELSPMVMSLEVEGLPLSASLDGITFDGEIIFEHKLFNEELAERVKNNNLEDHYKRQLDQQLMVSGASKCLFMTSDGTENNCAYVWYESNTKRENDVISAWKQFAADLENYVPVEVIAKPKAEAIAALPSVFVQATGMVTASNLSEFKESATAFIANIKTSLVNDQDFADAESTVKFCKEAEANIEQVKTSITAQMSTVDEVLRTLDHISAQLRDKRLMLGKLVASEKEARKLAIVSKAGNDFAEHATNLQNEIGSSVILGKMLSRPDFGAATKGLKSLSSMQEKVDTALRNSKAEADAVAKDVRAKLAWCKESSAGFGFLFSDLSALITNNGMEAFQAIVTGRIAQHKADQAAKEEAQRIAMQEEADRKAKAEADAILAAERAKMESEERARVAAEVKVQMEAQAEAKAKLDAEIKEEQATLKQYEKVENLGEVSAPVIKPTAGFNPKTRARANREEILEVLSENFGLPTEMMLDWILAEFADDIRFNNRKEA